MRNFPKVLVFVAEKELLPAGGPAAVCYYYNLEKQRRNDNFFSFLPNEKNSVSSYEAEANRLKNDNSISRIRYLLRTIIKYNLILGFYHSKVSVVDINDYDIIHFHDTMSLYRHRKQLKEFKGIVILQSHTPQPMAEEQYNVIPKSVKFWIPLLKKRLERVDRFAFNRADYIIFPCPEAEEPYLNRWPYFKHLKESRKNSFKYILTGIPASSPKRNKEDVFKELNLPNDSFLVSYVGRHNEVKGYGDLKNIGKVFLESDENAWFVCAGKEEPLKRLEHNRWIEVGWTKDAHSYISASDVFVLPNKETYFDIVMLEVLSLGKIVIASRTGGNKFFEKAGCKGVLLYDTIDEAVELLKKVSVMLPEERANLGKTNYEFYKAHNTVSAMYDQYIATINRIYQEGK